MMFQSTDKRFKKKVYDKKNYKTTMKCKWLNDIQEQQKKTRHDLVC